MFQWLVDNWERVYVRFDYEIYKYGLVMIVITLKYLYSVLTCWKITNKKYYFEIQIKVCELLIDSKNYERFVWKIEKSVNAII